MAKTKTTKKAPAAKPAKKMSAIDAAAKLLAASKEPMNCKALIETMAKKGLWTSPGGKTPHATLYTVVTMLPKTWRLGIDCSPETGCDRSMGRGGGRSKPMMVTGLRRTVPIERGCHGRHKNQKVAAADASGDAGVCRWPVGEAVVEPGV